MKINALHCIVLVISIFDYYAYLKKKEKKFYVYFCFHEYRIYENLTTEQSVPIATKVVSSNIDQGKLYNIM